MVASWRSRKVKKELATETTKRTVSASGGFPLRPWRPRSSRMKSSACRGVR